ncbi:RusA family crossover junction endodeoxyribonuclease [Nonomuraea purpurea]|uniref:RusA family crossover junction endodeoxyribonuclease n=1 Tax=Nonomuraea purpurea TaxID=1849276 RepID=A0ABV8GL09_9ACTN
MTLTPIDSPAVLVPRLIAHEEIQARNIVARFTIAGEAVTKGRPRFARRGKGVRTYTPADTLEAEAVVADAFRAAVPHHQPDKEYTYGLLAVFCVGNRKVRDVDNLLKLVLDGLNKIAWHDDAQVVELSGRKIYDLANPENARSEVVIYQVGEVPKPYRRPKRRAG